MALGEAQGYRGKLRSTGCAERPAPAGSRRRWQGRWLKQSGRWSRPVTSATSPGSRQRRTLCLVSSDVVVEYAERVVVGGAELAGDLGLPADARGVVLFAHGSG